jgi:glucan phosphoethanolaminetransferase (alkaline phosphatase superfamily)
VCCCCCCRRRLVDADCPFIANCVGHGNLRPFLLVLLYALVAAAYILCMCSLLLWQHWDEVKVSVGAAHSRQAGSHSSMMQQQVWVLNKSAGIAATDTGSSTEPVSSSSSRPDMWLLATSGIMVWVLQSSPWWMLAAYYLIAVSLALLVAVGALLASQLHYLGLGVSYVEHLKASSSPAAAQQAAGDAQVEGRWKQLRVIWARWWDVMGAGSGGHNKAWALLRPGWGVPEGPGSKKVM